MYICNLGIHFNSIVDQYADRIALKFSAKYAVTYRELNTLSNQITGFLKEKGIAKKDVVCLAGDKQIITFAAMIACLKIGAVYTIIDPQSPVERLRKIMSICRPKLLFANKQLQKSLLEITDGLEIETVENEALYFKQIISGFNTGNPTETEQITGSDPAYIMFTSGSTGFPKGAIMAHENVLNLINWSVEAFQITPDDILTNVNPLYFDNSVFDFYSALFSGACLVPFSKEQVTDHGMLVQLIDDFKCTQWFSVPTLLIFLQTMKALNKDNMKHIKRIIFGGEGYPKAKLKALFDLYGDRTSIINVYGPTECTCICSSYKISQEDFNDLNGFPALGKLIRNFSYLILDEDNKLTPDNEFGELCLMGPNVGKGYFNNRETTSKSFIQNPFNDQYREIIYKTGDLIKYNSDDGKIYIGGRMDNQIKHMGYRIELEEIETALSRIEYVSQAAVLHGSKRGLSRIVAVVSSASQWHENTLRDDLLKIIPDYMAPNIFYAVNELPKNPNGKVDRRKLAELYL